MDYFKKIGTKKKILMIVGAVVALVVGTYLLNLGNTYAQKQVTTFIESKFPEIKVISTAVSKDYPNIGTNIKLNYINYSDGTSEKNAFITLINANLPADSIQNIGEISCTALGESKMYVDNLIVQPIRQYSFAFFNFTYGTDSLGGDCDWWLGASTEVK